LDDIIKKFAENKKDAEKSRRIAENQKKLNMK
jgi:hypothetical protein